MRFIGRQGGGSVPTALLKILKSRAYRTASDLPADYSCQQIFEIKAADKAIEIAYKKHEHPSFSLAKLGRGLEEIGKGNSVLKHSGSKSETRARVLGIGLVILWLLVWEGSVQSGLGRNIFLPPSAVLSPLSITVRHGAKSRPHLWDTVTRLLVGFIIGAVPALWFGLCDGPK